MLQPLTFDDFSGGWTDQYIGVDEKRKVARVDNFTIDETKQPLVRNGTSIYATRILFSSGSTKPSGIYLGAEPYSHPVMIVGPHAYITNESTGWTEVTGGPALDGATDTNAAASFLASKTDSIKESSILWRRQLISAAPVTNLSPQMIYCTNYVAGSNSSQATYEAVTLGLPILSSVPAVAVSGSGFTFIYCFFYKVVIVDYTGTAFIYYGNPNALGFVTKNNSADPSSANILISSIPYLANTNGTTNYRYTTYSTTITYISGSKSATITGSASGIRPGLQITNADFPMNTYVQAVSGTTITFSQACTAGGTGVSTLFCPYSVVIGRTINGGTNFFQLGLVLVGSGSGSFTDNISDTTLQTQGTIYTAGGALGYDQPPTNVVAMAQVNDFFWYATSTTLYQSIQGNPGACPSSFQAQTDQKIKGLSDNVTYPLLFCDKSVYRIEGNFDSFGNGGFIPRTISHTAGCLSNSSIVKTPYGLFWFGNGGVYWTDGYQVKKISRHLNSNYQQFANTYSHGTYDPIGNFVYWTIDPYTGGNSNRNTAWLVLHLNFPITDESTFTSGSSFGNIYPTALAFSSATDLISADPTVTTTITLTNGQATATVGSGSGIAVGQTVVCQGVPYGTTVTAISGTSVTLSNAANQNLVSVAVTFSQIIFSQFYNRLLMADANGYLLWFDPNSYTDPWINTLVAPSSMAKQTIIYDLITVGLDQGVPGFRKFTADMNLEVDCPTNLSMQIKHRRDDGGQLWSGDGGTPPNYVYSQKNSPCIGSPGGGTTGSPAVPEVRADNAILWNITDFPWETVVSAEPYLATEDGSILDTESGQAISQ